MRTRIAMADEGNGNLRARNLKPDGDVHGTPFAKPFEGAAGDVFRASIGIITLQS